MRPPYRQYIDDQVLGGRQGGSAGGGDGGFSGGQPERPGPVRGRFAPPAPSPGLGTGTPAPFMFEDGSMAYEGRFEDKLLMLLSDLLNQRFPNGR